MCERAKGIARDRDSTTDMNLTRGGNQSKPSEHAPVPDVKDSSLPLVMIEGAQAGAGEVEGTEQPGLDAVVLEVGVLEPHPSLLG